MRTMTQQGGRAVSSGLRRVAVAVPVGSSPSEVCSRRWLRVPADASASDWCDDSTDAAGGGVSGGAGRSETNNFRLSRLVSPPLRHPLTRRPAAAATTNWERTQERRKGGEETSSREAPAPTAANRSVVQCSATRWAAAARNPPPTRVARPHAPSFAVALARPSQLSMHRAASMGDDSSR